MEQGNTGNRGQESSIEAASDGQTKAQGKEPIPTTKPSQAEGDRETVLEDIKEKEAEGKI